MITIDDLKESLRRQLGALIEIYEAGMRPAAAAAVGDPVAQKAAGNGPGMQEGARDGAEAARVAAIECCLKDFQAAILAAEEAERLRLRIQEVAAALQARAASARRVAAAIQRDALEIRRAFGDAGPRGELDLRRLAEARAAARVGDMVCRRTEADAQLARERYEQIAAAALNALLAAARADPGRGNRDFDPHFARTARHAAEQAAVQAQRLGAVCVEASATRDDEGEAGQRETQGLATNGSRPDTK